MTCDLLIALPDQRCVDFSDGFAVGDFTHLLLSLLQCGCECIPKVTGLRNHVSTWLRTVKSDACLIPSQGIVPALEGFDILHRLFYKEAAPVGFIGGCYLRAFEARISGNIEVDESALFSAVSNRIRLHDHNFYGMPLHWYSDILERLHREFRRRGDFNGVSLSTILDRVRLLLGEDLYAFEGRHQEAFKSWLAASYLPSVTDMTSVEDNAETLRSKLHFLRSAYPWLSPDDQRLVANLEQRIIHLLSDCQDLSDIARQAYSLDMKLLGIGN